MVPLQLQQLGKNAICDEKGYDTGSKIRTYFCRFWDGPIHHPHQVSVQILVE